jgi:hypothetical protein
MLLVPAEYEMSKCRKTGCQFLFITGVSPAQSKRDKFTPPCMILSRQKCIISKSVKLAACLAGQIGPQRVFSLGRENITILAALHATIVTEI